MKYHESLIDKPAKLRDRYDEVAAGMGCFRQADLPKPKDQPLQQIWRDHLLAGAMLQVDLGYTEGAFVFLFPKDNCRCADAVAAYQGCLTSSETFIPWTLEGVVAAGSGWQNSKSAIWDSIESSWR